jgi:hypothetical protein
MSLKEVILEFVFSHCKQIEVNCKQCLYTVISPISPNPYIVFFVQVSFIPNHVFQMKVLFKICL